MQLDIRTSLVIATFVSLVPTLIGALVWKRGRICPGFGRWTLGNLLGTLCLLFLSLRGAAPDWISIVLANALALGAAILFFQGILLFRGLQLHWWPECLGAVFAIAAVIYFRYVTNNLNARAIAMSAVLGSFGLGCGFTLLRQKPVGRTFGMVVTGIVALLAGVSNFFRVYFFASVPVSDLLAPSNLNVAFFTASGLAIVGWSFGFLLMKDERLAWNLVSVAVETPLSKDRVESNALFRVVPEAEVRQQVQKIVESEIFRRSASMERFLVFAADRVLTGHQDELKEYILGRDVFNRGDKYDPRTDSIVRVEAQRLRRKLREYYQSDGSHDAVIVEFHAGSYVPRFRYRDYTEFTVHFNR